MTTVTAGVPPTLLEVRDLAISYLSRRSTVEAVRGVTFDVAPGEIVALVGGSGSGKTTTAAAIVGQFAGTGKIVAGSVDFKGSHLARLNERGLRAIRGRDIGFVPQDPGVALNPVIRIDRQLREVLDIHKIGTKEERGARVITLLHQAGLPKAEIVAQQYPHQLSGGLKQRVLIAMAIACSPSLIIADEPTSALDVTIQRQILDHIDSLIASTTVGVLLVTHDLGIAGERADRILVMSNGKLVESGTSQQILDDPQHAYTKHLIESAPSLSAVRPGRRTRAARVSPDDDGTPILTVTNVTKQFTLPKMGGVNEYLTAVDDVSLSVDRGETLSIVGESGSGKTTLARMVLRLESPTSGTIRFDGEDITTVKEEPLRQLRRRIQCVYQNPYTSLNPKFTIADLVEEPLRAYKVGTRAERYRRVAELIDNVALPGSVLSRRPAELSGGQRQRVAIARALALEPDVVVLDEPVSALDVIVQAQILDLLVELQQEMGTAYLFISHDLAVVREISDRVGVMHLGKLVEIGPTEEILERPKDAYTKRLVDAIPTGRRDRTSA
jgi:peptide/nickel transport system ATP-binding protein